MNRAKKSGAKDFLGLFAIIFSMVLLVYLMVENYMGYTGVQSVMQKNHEQKAKQRLLERALKDRKTAGN